MSRSISVSPLEFEITRVDCTCIPCDADVDLLDRVLSITFPRNLLKLS